MSKTFNVDNNSTLPWIEKHRPNRLDNIKIDSHIKTQIEKMIKSKDVPNIILEGPPGVGKTSTIKCIARDIYRRYYKDMVLEMNASDDRGIKIQEPIEAFRKAYVHINDQDKNSIPRFKMVILDEADNMTDKAKHIISGFIKNCVSDLRFAFTCNSKDNIIPSIQSGCHIVKYPPLTDKIVDGRLHEICVIEGIITNDTTKKELKIIEEGIDAISQITNGDMRFAINILQLTYNRFGSIKSDNVYNIQDKPHPEKSKDIIVCCMNGKLGDAISKVSDLRLCGYSGTDIALGLRLALRLDICNNIPEHIKIAFWKCISYASYNISKGLDSSLLQVTACVADMYQSALKIKSLDLIQSNQIKSIKSIK
jgi:replication factor C subunit 2/4